MQILGRVISLLLHPFLSPLYGILLFQWINPRTVNSFWPLNHYIPIFILTCLIPGAGWAIGHQLRFNKPSKKKKTKTILSYLFFILALILLIAGPFPLPFSPEINYFFMGLIIAFLTYLAVFLLGYSIDHHLVGAGNLLAFLIFISLFFAVGLTEVIACILFLTGLLASFRIYLTKTGYAGILIGWLIGLSAQLTTLKLWI